MIDNIEINTQGHFLIAMPSLDCPVFSGSMIFMLEHNEQGAIGLIINQPLNIRTDEILRQINPSYEYARPPKNLFFGGPVATERGFVLHRPGKTTWKNQIELLSNLAITTSTDILESMSQGNGIDEYMIALGYAGWGPGQLEQELVCNAWLTVDTDPIKILNSEPEQRIAVAISKLGIDYGQLSDETGHA